MDVEGIHTPYGKLLMLQTSITFAMSKKKNCTTNFKGLLQRGGSHLQNYEFSYEKIFSLFSQRCLNLEISVEHISNVFVIVLLNYLFLNIYCNN